MTRRNHSSTLLGRFYIDDLLIHGITEEETLHKFEQVLQVCKKKAVKLKQKKSNILHKEVKYLGYIVNEEGYWPDG